MPKDYAKKSNVQKRKRQRTSKKAPGWLWLSTALLFSLLITSLVYLYHHQSVSVAQQPKKPHKLASKTQKHVQKNHPMFEFYTLLPKTQASPATVSNPTSKKQFKHLYILQIASLRQQASADHLKAQLSLLGFDITVHSVHNKKGHWYRINTGPYTSLSSAEQAQDQLRRERINSVLLKIPQK